MIEIYDTKPQDIVWIPFSSGVLPNDGDEIFISLWIDDSYGKGNEISYETDVAVFSLYQGYLPVEVEGNIIGWVDSCNDWSEGQPIKILAWWPIPKPYKEDSNK